MLMLKNGGLFMGIEKSKKELMVELAVVFEESMSLIESSKELKESVAASIEKSYTIHNYDDIMWERVDALHPGLEDEIVRRNELGNNNISIIEDTSFNVARTLKKKYNGKKRVAVLNFANPIKPGGGVVNGATAQEESLCRCSTLYPVLKGCTGKGSFYEYHNFYYNYRKLIKSNEVDMTAILYTPDIYVFNDDSYNRLNEYEKIDVITCAAPDLRRVTCDEVRLTEIFDRKIQGILEMAMLKEVQVLVLGAFGCGAFKNPPTLVADSFYRILHSEFKEGLCYRDCFNEVAFAIRNHSEGKNDNYKAFSERFSWN